MLGKVKTESEIQAMREGGKLLACVFQVLKTNTRAGISELELDAIAAKEIMRLGAEATYRTKEVNFPATICISTNDKVQHSVPTEYLLKKGDIINFDLVITYRGMKTDSGFTMMVEEEPTGDKKRLLEMTESALYAGIDAIHGPTRIGDISAAIEAVLRAGNLGIVKELVGHGIGHSMHEAPDIPNYGRAGTGLLLEPGDTIAIEPISTLGEGAIMEDEDGWTLRTRDGSLSAQFEHTILVTKDGAEILTKL